jgi:hypothetical protein
MIVAPCKFSSSPVFGYLCCEFSTCTTHFAASSTASMTFCEEVFRAPQLFNTLQIPISGVAGINDELAAGGLVAGGIPTFHGTCGTCHDTPSVGNHSFPTPLNIGTADPNPTNRSVNLGGLECELSAGNHRLPKRRGHRSTHKRMQNNDRSWPSAHMRIISPMDSPKR